MKYVLALGWTGAVAPIALVSTETNTNTSYAIELLSNSTYMSLVALNNPFQNGTNYTFVERVSTSLITNNFTECYVSAIPAAVGAPPLIHWFRANIIPFNYTFPTPSTVVMKQLHSNNSNFFFTYDNTTSNGSVFIFSTAFSGQPTYFNQIQFSNCTTITGDIYQASLLVGCGNKIYILNSYAPYSQINVINISFALDTVTGMADNSLLAASSLLGLMGQYNVLDGTLMDIKVINMANASLRRVN